VSDITTKVIDRTKMTKNKSNATASKQRMQELVTALNEARRAYEQEDVELMSNYQYDSLYDELLDIEKELGIQLSNSPTREVGYQVLSTLPKEHHPAPMLSLDKTKEVGVLSTFLGTQEGVLSWKMDGLTVVLTYQGGQLLKAVTRGNGEVGEVITANAEVFENVPLKIPFQGELVLRGEAVISYADFATINEAIDDEIAKYKNPRNLVSGSVRQLNTKITAERKVRLIAFALVSVVSPVTDRKAQEDVPFTSSTDHRALIQSSNAQPLSPEFMATRFQQLDWLSSQGFEVVEHVLVTAETIAETVQTFAQKIEHYPYPSDGLVLLYNDISYGKSLGMTSKFPRDAIAFKWQDEIAETTLRMIEWNPSRTGLLNPIAHFDPVELEGTTVAKASVHNVSIVEQLQLGIGDTITVYKANMIIPQIAENLTRSGALALPNNCPACGGSLEIRQDGTTKTLHCPNLECPAKHLQSFVHFVSRDALNVDGLSEKSLEKLIDSGCIRDLSSLFHLSDYKSRIIAMEGFEEKSFSNLLDSIERARHTTLPRLLYGLGVPGIGLATAKAICKHFRQSAQALLTANVSDLFEVDGVGEIIANDFVSFFALDTHRALYRDLLTEVVLPDITEAENAPQSLTGLSFVITGSLETYENRDALKEVIETAGGKVIGSVSKKTDYLINNDVHSSSSKNKKAQELGIPIIDEQAFRKLLSTKVITK